MDGPTYSIVIPIFNEEETLDELLSRMIALMDRLDGSAEVVLVDDGSTDSSYDRLTTAAGRDPRFKVLQLSRNFGHQIAITAGLDFSSGEAVAVMDADLQDPPEVILDMAAKWREGFEVVYAVRERREGEGAFKRTTARVFYRALRRLTDIEAPLDVGDFRLVDRKALEAFKGMRESNRYVRGMFTWIGFKQTGVKYTRAERYAGTTKFSFRKMAKFALDGVVSFSDVPLRLALNLGFLLAGLSFLGGAAALISKLTGAYVVPGWASLVVVTAFLGGIQLIILGVLGAYIARIHDEVKNRPLYLVRDAHNFPLRVRSEPRRVIRPAEPGRSGEVEIEEIYPTPPA